MRPTNLLGLLETPKINALKSRFVGRMSKERKFQIDNNKEKKKKTRTDDKTTDRVGPSNGQMFSEALVTIAVVAPWSLILIKIIYSGMINGFK